MIATTIKLSIWFDGLETEVDEAIAEVRYMLQEEFNGICKPRIEEVLKEMGAKNVRIAFIAY